MFHDEDNERAIISVCLRDYKNVVPGLMSMLSPQDFYKTFHQDAFSSICSLFRESKTINPTTVMTCLKKQGKTYDLGMFKTLTDEYFTTAGWEQYASRVKECSVRRSLCNVAHTIQKQNNDGELLDSILAEASANVTRLIDSARGNRGAVRHIKDAVYDFMDLLEKHKDTGLNGPRKVKTGFGYFDNRMGGLRRGSLIYLGGRPSMGKSTISFQWALNVTRAGGTALVCSFEIPGPDMMSKMVSLRHGIPGEDFEKPISDYTFTRITTACGMLSGTNLIFTDKAMTVSEIMLEAQHINDTVGKLDLIVIDRLELIKDRPLPGENRALHLGRISQALNSIAISMDIPLVCLVQLSREAARRGAEGSHRPILSDFRDSGAIEQDAKMALMIHREDMYRADKDKDGKAELIIAKNMFGKTGYVPLIFRESIPEFHEEEQDARDI